MKNPRPPPQSLHRCCPETCLRGRGTGRTEGWHDEERTGGVRGRIGSEGDDVVHAGADRRDVEKTKVERHRVTGGQRRESAEGKDDGGIAC